MLTALAAVSSSISTALFAIIQLQSSVGMVVIGGAVTVKSNVATAASATGGLIPPSGVYVRPQRSTTLAAAVIPSTALRSYVVLHGPPLVFSAPTEASYVASHSNADGRSWLSTAQSCARAAPDARQTHSASSAAVQRYFIFDMPRLLDR